MIEESFLVSGYEFYKLSTVSFCPRYHKKNIDIEENDLVFVNLDSFAEFLKNLPTKKFRLITHNSDSTFSEDHLNAVKNHANKIYPINCTVSSCSLIQKIPLGFVDSLYKPHSIFSQIEKEENTKSIFVYSNFSVNTNPSERNKCLDFFKDKSYVTKEQNIPPIDFYRQLSRSQYSLSPEGTGIDCHRIYESIFFDCVPIIKSCPLDDFYENMPVLIVEDWADVSEKFLEQRYDEFFEKLINWKTKNYNWYKAKYWIS